MLFQQAGNYSRAVTYVFVVSFIICGFSVAQSQDISPDLYKELNYRYIGPDGNRVIAVVGEPGNSNVVYAGAASGGIFKTTDGGNSWNPIFDDQDVSSVGSLAIAPSDYNIVWAGTGETFIRSNISVGNGIYKSTDRGKTWTNMGLEKTGRIGRVVIHPTDPNIVFAAALGHAYGPQQERGVYRTMDGGETWERVLFVDENTGASDVAIDPNNPLILIAGMWPIEIKTWVRKSGGPGGGLHMSKDGGTTWKKLTGSGLPKTEMGKIAVAFAPSNSNRIYALIETPQYDFAGVLFRSDNGGSSWSLISHDQQYTQRPHYYTRVTVAPDNDDEAYFMAHGVWKTQDGGKTSTRVPQVGGDDHDMWIDPLNPDRMLVANDGGVRLSVNRGQTWFRPQLPTGQMYHVSVDNQVPYYVYGNRQDGPSRRGPSNSRGRGSIPIGMWESVGGGESGFTYPDPVDNNIIWSANYDGHLTRFDLKTGHARNVRVWPDEPMGWGPSELKYRWNWTFPIAISPHDHNKVYVGSQVVHVTTNGGHSWDVISPDLTTNDKSRQLTSGGLTIDNIGVDFGSTLFAIAESPIEEGLIWTGSNDGFVQLTRDGGRSWKNVTKNIPDLPEWGTISNIEPSRYNAGTAYISVDLHQVNNRDPFAYKTENYGESWKLITEDIPKSMLSYVHVIREDPVREGMLYIGTENSVYVSLDDGRNWLPLQNNLPHAPAHWLVIQEHFSDLVIATYGRGFWIMDDITPLRQLDDDIVNSDAHLFDLRPAYRFQSVGSPASSGTAADGRNPQYGASINYFIGEVPDEDVKISIIDNSGQVIRELDGTKKKGINRVMWDLRHERATEPHLRTPPLGHPGVEAGPERLRYNDDGWRTLITWGNGGYAGPMAVPGNFTVKLKVGDKEFTTPLEVLKDPNTAAAQQEIEEQINLGLKVRDNISAVAEMINTLEWIRKQIDDLTPMVEENEDLESFMDVVDEFDQKSIDVEKNFFQLTLTGTGADDLRGPTMLYSKLMNLARGITTGDFPPTVQQVEVHELLEGILYDYKRLFDSLINNDLPAFNRELREKNLSTIMAPGTGRKGA